MAGIPLPDPWVGAAVIQGGRPLLAVKDNIDVAGLATRAGLGGPGVIAAADAPVVAALRAAGWGIAAHTRMDEAALGASGENAHHGRVENPAFPGRSPGGSSGGSAAAVAAGLVDGALGTDTLGSVRIPAAWCGVVGLKPSRGLLPMAGVVPLSPSLDHVGLLARDAAGVGAMLRAFVPEDAAASPVRVGVVTVEGVSAAVAVEVAAGVERLRGLGCEVGACAIGGWDARALRRAALLLIEAEGAVVHAGLLEGGAAMSEEVRAMLRYGRDCGSARVVRAVQVLRAAEAGVLAALRTWDVLALPVTPGVAHAWGAPADPEVAVFCALANWPGLPALSVPMGGGAGLQLVGRMGADWGLLRLAAAIGR